jgi:hypothetical protein
MNERFEVGEAVVRVVAEGDLASDVRRKVVEGRQAAAGGIRVTMGQALKLAAGNPRAMADLAAAGIAPPGGRRPIPDFMRADPERRRQVAERGVASEAFAAQRKRHEGEATAEKARRFRAQEGELTQRHAERQVAHGAFAALQQRKDDAQRASELQLKIAREQEAAWKETRRSMQVASAGFLAFGTAGFHLGAPGQARQLDRAVADFTAVVGRSLAPMLNDVTRIVRKAADFVDRHPGATRAAGWAAAGIGTVAAGEFAVSRGTRFVRGGAGLVGRVPGPWWVRAGVGLAATAATAGAGYGVYRGVQALAAGEPDGNSFGAAKMPARFQAPEQAFKGLLAEFLEASQDALPKRQLEEAQKQTGFLQQIAEQIADNFGALGGSDASAAVGAAARDQVGQILAVPTPLPGR